MCVCVCILSSTKTSIRGVPHTKSFAGLSIEDSMSSSLEVDERQGEHVCDSCDEHGGVSDFLAKTNAGRVGHAERKRELERNRRNLINARFVELGMELRRSEKDNADDESQDNPRVKRPRMDKEALLKEASMRLMVQHKELTSANARLKDLLAQIDAMRMEMGDLRKDKCSLRYEVQRLRSSNTNLWKIIQQSQFSKLTALLDPTKLAADIFAPITGETETLEDDMVTPKNETGVRNDQESTLAGVIESRLDSGAIQNGGFQLGLPFFEKEQAQQSVVNISGNNGGTTVNVSLRKEIQDSNGSMLFTSFGNQETTLASLFPTSLPKHHLTTIDAVQTTNADLCIPISSTVLTTQTWTQDHDLSYDNGKSEYTT